MRTSTFTVSVPPRCMNSRSWITRNSLVCVSGPTVPISSKKMVPWSATSKRPFLEATALVKAPRTWPNKVLSSKIDGHAAGVDRHKETVRPGTIGMDGFGDEFLAGAALPLNQDGGPAGRNLPDQVELFPLSYLFVMSRAEGVERSGTLVPELKPHSPLRNYRN